MTEKRAVTLSAAKGLHLDRLLIASAVSSLFPSSWEKEQSERHGGGVGEVADHRAGAFLAQEDFKRYGETDGIHGI